MRHACLLVALAMLPLAGSAQNAKPRPHVKSYTTCAPDTIVQGVPFTVEYRLESRSWHAGGHPLCGNGFVLTDVRYASYKGTYYSTSMTDATYVYMGRGGETVETPGEVMYVRNDTLHPASKRVYVKRNPSYGKEMDAAVEWLLAHGCNMDSLYLKAVWRDEYMMVLDDERYGHFCIVAKEQALPLVGHPILAYSTESSLQPRNSKNWATAVIKSYRKQIERLRQEGRQCSAAPSVSFSAAAEPGCGPLLGGMAWGQSHPFNMNAPTISGRKVPMGCVPVAVGMVMNHYGWPDRGTSHVFYKPDKRTFELDFSKLSPRWSDYADSYAADDSSEVASDLSRTLVFLAFSLDADFGEKGTSAKLANVKHVLCNNLGYSAGMRYYYRELPDMDMPVTIRRELDDGRPCILSNDSHAFVCDGYRGEFFHYNPGWSGYCNGYYRLSLGDYAQTEESLLMPTGVLCGIEPRRQEYVKEVSLPKPGMLESFFTEEEKAKVTGLTVTGPLNSTDIIFLRRLAGAQDSLSLGGRGTLRTLDLSNASISADKTPYLVVRATDGYTYSSWESYGGPIRYNLESKKYDFMHMDEKAWKMFKSTVGSKMPNVYYTRSGDNEYYAHYKCQSNVVGDRMFWNCTSLHSIILPLKTKAIGDAAFAGCISLQSVRIPKKVTEIGQFVFSGCSALEKIALPMGSEVSLTLSPGCSPALHVVRYRD